MPIAEDISKLQEIKLADGSTRHLRFTLGARKRIKDKFGSEPVQILQVPPEELLPVILLEGLVEKEGVTEETILETLVEASMTDYVIECFVKAFFVPRVVQNLVLMFEEMKRPLDMNIVKTALGHKTEIPALPITNEIQ